MEAVDSEGSKGGAPWVIANDGGYIIQGPGVGTASRGGSWAGPTRTMERIWRGTGSVLDGGGHPSACIVRRLGPRCSRSAFGHGIGCSSGCLPGTQMASTRYERTRHPHSRSMDRPFRRPWCNLGDRGCVGSHTAPRICRRTAWRSFGSYGCVERCGRNRRGHRHERLRRESRFRSHSRRQTMAVTGIGLCRWSHRVF